MLVCGWSKYSKHTIAIPIYIDFTVHDDLYLNKMSTRKRLKAKIKNQIITFKE